jgi:hypothetical protein
MERLHSTGIRSMRSSSDGVCSKLLTWFCHKCCPGARQYGRASAPTIPHLVHTMRGPNIGNTKEECVTALDDDQAGVMPTS